MNRRQILSGAAALPLLASPALAQPAGDARLESLWLEYLAAQHAVYSDPEADDDVAEAQANRKDAVEVAIMNEPSSSARGAVIKLWVSVPHADSDRWIEEAIAFGRLDEVIARERELDWPARLIVSAIRSLS